MNRVQKTFVIDLFCGAGGTSTAIHTAGTNIEVVACINHDANAIRSHAENYPMCVHYTEDIRTIALQPIVEQIELLRKRNPGCKIAIWASLECTNFSRAKQGPKNADSRTLAEHMFRYINAIQPDFFWVENVTEFMDWGPLKPDGMPDKSRLGKAYQSWKERLTRHYFSKNMYEAQLVSADYGGRTIRRRLFLQFARDPQLIGIPKQTHSAKGNIGEPWLPVVDVLDLENPGNSIFTRKKLLVPNTHKNIYKGLVKFPATQGMIFGYTYYGNSGFVPLDKPSPTLTTKDRIAMVSIAPLCIHQQYGNANMRSIEKPFPTLTTVPKGDIISVKRITFMVNPQYGGSTRGTDVPAGTIIARQDKAPLAVAAVPEHRLESDLVEAKGTGTNHIQYVDGRIVYTIYESDDEWLVLIKKYMHGHQLLDILMRPLTIVEMLQIQGFPSDYVLKGTQTEQKKYIGNSVEVKVGVALFKAIDNQIQNHVTRRIKETT